MIEKVSAHYGSGGDLAEKIAEGLQSAGKNLKDLNTVDLSAVDEFHFRGRKATLQLAEQMKLDENALVLDIGSGLGGPARTLAEEYGCRVIGIDLTNAFCEVAGIMSNWVKLAERTDFQQGDATNLPFSDNQFDAAMTLHVAMNIAAKDKMYEQARRVVKPGGIFAVYDILQGDGGEVLFPAPWARDPSISHLATPVEMKKLFSDAGFRLLDVHDSTDESLGWLEARTAGTIQSGPSPVTTQILFGDDFPEMTRNQIRGLRERRIRTVSYICEA
ncbi:MAG: class I SAM-dependent methyltransferase [Gammaproteobacteria bacterium]